MSRAAICHCPEGAYYDRTLHFVPHPSIESCLAAGGRHPKQGQGDCDAPVPAGAMIPPIPPDDRSGYDRALFGGWADADGDCRSTRQEVLAALSTGPVRWSANGCEVERGRWIDPYTGPSTSTRAGSTWTTWCRWPTPGAAARTNGTPPRARPSPTTPRTSCPSRPGSTARRARAALWAWLPPDEGFRCQYVLRFERVLRTHGLRAPEDEAQALAALRAQACG